MTEPCKKSKKLERIVGHGNPALFGILKGKTRLQVDGVLSIVPGHFYQSMVVMAFDYQADPCAPITHVLMTGKTEELRWRALH